MMPDITMEWKSIVKDADSILETNFDLGAALLLVHGYAAHACMISGRPKPNIDISEIELELLNNYGNTMTARKKLLEYYINELERILFSGKHPTLI